MAAKRKIKEWTTIRIRWKTKDAFVKEGVGRETDDGILQRILKERGVKINGD